jgi:DNA polymerase-3 subunit gamma/tau
MTQALYRKWRPQSWEAVIGQDHVVQTLRNAISADRVAHAYLFAGPRGTGKTTTARLLAKAVNCLDADLAARPCGKCEPCLAVAQGRYLDLIEIDAASNTSVEDVRDLRDKINFSPNTGRYKIYIIDEVHMLSTAAFNALLKTLEEPPAHAIFILATTEVHKIPATVLSRCQRHEFRRIPVADIVAVLKSIAQEEGISVDAAALAAIARQSTGAMRDAISLLDQLASTGQLVTLELAQMVMGTATSQSVVELVDALIARQPAGGLEQIHQALDSGSDPRQFARQVVDYLRGLLLIKMGYAAQEETPEMKANMARHAQAFSTATLLEIIQAFNQTTGSESRSPWQPALPLEMAWVAALDALAEPAAAPHSAPQTTAGGKSKSAEKAHGQPATPAALARPEPAGGALDSAAPAAEGELTIQKVEEHWRSIVSQVGKVSRSTQTALNSCKPYGIKDGTLYLGFNGDFAKNKMEEGNNIEITRKVIQEVLGVDMPLRCFVARGERGKLPPEVEGDSMVAAVLRDLGGEIVDVQ